MGASAGTHASLFALWATLDKLDQTLSSRVGPERPNSVDYEVTNTNDFSEVFCGLSFLITQMGGMGLTPQITLLGI